MERPCCLTWHKIYQKPHTSVWGKNSSQEYQKYKISNYGHKKKKNNNLKNMTFSKI